MLVPQKRWPISPFRRRPYKPLPVGILLSEIPHSSLPTATNMSAFDELSGIDLTTKFGPVYWGKIIGFFCCIDIDAFLQALSSPCCSCFSFRIFLNFTSFSSLGGITVVQAYLYYLPSNYSQAKDGISVRLTVSKVLKFRLWLF